MLGRADFETFSTSGFGLTGPTTPETTRIGGPRVLVVDESPTIRALATDILVAQGYDAGHVRTLTRPDDALAAVDETTPETVFMDLDDEAGLTAALEMLERNPRLKVVGLTAEGRSSERVRRAVRAGVFDVVEKPLRREKIRRVLTTISIEAGGLQRIR